MHAWRAAQGAVAWHASHATPRTPTDVARNTVHPPVGKIASLAVALAAVKEHKEVGCIPQHAKAAAPQLCCIPAALEAAGHGHKFADSVGKRLERWSKARGMPTQLTAWRAASARRNEALGCQTPCRRGGAAGVQILNPEPSAAEQSCPKDQHAWPATASKTSSTELVGAPLPPSPASLLCVLVVPVPRAAHISKELVDVAQKHLRQSRGI